MQLHDWEVEATYHNYKKRYGSPEKALEKMVERLSLLERMMSNMRAYSRLPSTKRRSERLVRLVQEAVAMAREALSADGKLKGNIEIEIAINELALAK